MQLRNFSRIAIFVATILIANSGMLLAEDNTRCFLVGNSLTWDTVPSKLDGDTQWHVDCGKSLPYMVQHPEAPCVDSSTIWPKALQSKQYDIISLQVHYGSTITEDVKAITQLIVDQPKARVIIHTGWARSAERVEEWKQKPSSPAAGPLKMQHSLLYFNALLDTLKQQHPKRSFQRTYAMDLLQLVEDDIAADRGPLTGVADLYRDKIHMNVVTGRYLMHNAMRHALGQPRSAVGFQKLGSEMKTYLDSVLDRGLSQRVSETSPKN